MGMERSSKRGEQTQSQEEPEEGGANDCGAGAWSLSCRRGGQEQQRRKRELERLRSIGITRRGLPLLGASASGRLFLLLEPGP